MDFTIKTESAATWLVTSKHLRQPEIPEFAGHAVGDVEEKARALKLKVAGPPIFVYREGDESTQEVTLDIAIPVDESKGDPKPFAFQQPSAFKCISAQYAGPMTGIQGAWKEMQAYVKQSGYKHAGVSREVYHVWKDFDSAENITELQVGIK